MATLDLEAEYNNRARVPDHGAVQDRLARLSEDVRKAAGGAAELDRSYGAGERQKYDLFKPKSGGGNVAALVYIHGGYWQRGDRKGNSFVARELNARGITVAVPSYSLCPAVAVMDIVAELRSCVKAVHDATKQRIVVAGHSAGGHLAAAMLATDWSRVAGAPADLVKAAYAISGVFDLPPLVTTSINEGLKLDVAKAREASVTGWPAPPKDRTFVAGVGGDESQELIRQSLAIAGAWSRAGVKAECVIVPATNHFTVVEELTRPDSAMLARVALMCGR